MVQKWVSKYDFGRSRIHDPLLTGAAWSHARAARAAADHWLASHNLTMDAVVSSVLARAIQTALLTYPQGASSPLHVVPYIREFGYGLSNAPKDRWDQVQDLNRSLAGSGAFRLDYRWTDVYGSDKVSWPKFENFLAQSFLPALIRDKGKKPGSTIVLGVVSHSKFLAKSAVADHCQEHWTRRGEKKPLNNQILAVPYLFKVSPPKPGSIDRTKRYSLDVKSASPCEEAFGGASGIEEKTGHQYQLCFPDIGDDCNHVIQKHALWPRSLYSQTREAKMLVTAQSVEDIQKEIAQDQQSLKNGDLHGPGGTTVGIDSSALIHDMEAKIANDKARAQALLDQIAAQRAEKCWSGATPDVLKFCEFEGDKMVECTKPSVIELAAGTATAAPAQLG